MTVLLMKLLLSFAIPFCWIFLLYPIFRKLNAAWQYLLIATSVFSVLLLIFKEMIDGGDLVNDITIYVSGVFLASAVIAYVFTTKSRWLKVLPKDDSFLNAFSFKRDMPLQDVLQIGILAEEDGKNFYEALSRKSKDPGTKELCARLARSEVEHREKLRRWLSRWLSVPIGSDRLAGLYGDLKERGVFANSPSENATEDEMVKYTLLQEKKMEEFFLSFKGGFPEAWENMQIDSLAIEERKHARVIMDRYPHLKIP